MAFANLSTEGRLKKAALSVLPWLLATTLAFAGNPGAKTRIKPGITIVPHIFDPYSTNHGQLEASWIESPERGAQVKDVKAANKILFFKKATRSSDPGIPYATVNGTEGLQLRELGYEVATRRSPGFKPAHCGVSPNIEITLTNHTTYSFRCENGEHTPVAATAWERVRFRDKDAIPISCSPTPKCELKPWPGFGSAGAVVAKPPDNDPKSFTFLIIMMDGLDYDPDFSGTVYMNKVEVNGSQVQGPGAVSTR